MDVMIPSQLQAYTGGASRVTASGETLGDVLENLDEVYPGIRFRMLDEQDRIREHIRIFVSGEPATTVELVLEEHDEVQIVGALSGG
ncbi:MAG: MoaD/ThiS family protein [Pseudomonadales bacterium]